MTLETCTCELRLTKSSGCCIETVFSSIFLAFYSLHFFFYQNRRKNTRMRQIFIERTNRYSLQTLLSPVFFISCSFKDFSCGPAVREICKIYKISFSWDHNNMANLLKFQTVYFIKTKKLQCLFLDYNIYIHFFDKNGHGGGVIPKLNYLPIRS